MIEDGMNATFLQDRVRLGRATCQSGAVGCMRFPPKRRSVKALAVRDASPTQSLQMSTGVRQQAHK